MSKARDLRDKSVEELEAAYNDARRELFEIKNAKERDKKMEKSHLLRSTKREIARLLTILGERQLASEKSAT